MKDNKYNHLAEIIIIDETNSFSESEFLKARVRFLTSFEDEAYAKKVRNEIQLKSNHNEKYDGHEQIIKLKLNGKLKKTLQKKYIYEVNTDKFSKVINEKDNNIPTLSYLGTFRIARDINVVPLEEDVVLRQNEEKLVFLDTFTEEEKLNLHNLIEIKKSFEVEIEETTNFDKYTIFDVNGFYSCLKKGNTTIIIDAGHESSSGAKIKKQVVDYLFISHGHFDHFNLWRNFHVTKIAVLPFNTGIRMGTRQFYKKELLKLYYDRGLPRLFIGSSLPTRPKRIALKLLKVHRDIEIFYPNFMSINPENSNSLCFKFKINDSTVFYPGDTMHYIYSPHLKNVTHLIASHHGGYVGTLSFKIPNPIKCLYINTSRRNESSRKFRDNQIIYNDAFFPAYRRIAILNNYNLSSCTIMKSCGCHDCI